MINVSAGSWHSQWVQISISTPRRAVYSRSPGELFSAAVDFGPERNSACWVWVAVGWLLSALWLLWIPSLIWNSPHSGLAHPGAHSVHPGGRACPLRRLSSALHRDGRQILRVADGPAHAPLSCQTCLMVAKQRAVWVMLKRPRSQLHFCLMIPHTTPVLTCLCRNWDQATDATGSPKLIPPLPFPRKET